MNRIPWLPMKTKTIPPVRPVRVTARAVTFNADQSLFVIPESHGGYSCLGLDVCRNRMDKLASEFGEFAASYGDPMATYAAYQSYVRRAKERHERTGWRSQSDLTRELIGLEGKRVEIVHTWPSGERETVRFIVGKSTGFIPCHLAIARRNSSGGCAVCLGKIESVRTV